ncbi:MAG: UbiA family prenyltransferase [Nitrososphaerales archaeon]
MSIINYLELTRISGIFTAVSNISLGYMLSYHQEIQFSSLLHLITISSLLYCGGMALNDFFDYRTDTTEHPKRVIPSGRIKRKNAGIFGFSVLILACILALYSGITSLGIAALISVLIVVYNRFSKEILVVGALNMASIRFFNVMLGSSTEGINELALLAALALFTFVFGITMISRKEGAFLRDITAPGLILVGVVIAYVLTLHIAGVFANHYIGLFIAVFAFLSLLPYKVKNAKVEKLVGSLVISMILLDATLIAGNGEILFGVFVAMLYIPSFALSRVIRVS